MVVNRVILKEIVKEPPIRHFGHVFMNNKGMKHAINNFYYVKTWKQITMTIFFWTVLGERCLFVLGI